MGLADWVTNEVNTTTSISAASPIAGSNSLLKSITGVVARSATRINSAYGNGLRSGRIRTLVKTSAFGSNTNYFGIWCYGALADMSTTSSFGHAFFIQGNGAYLCEFTGGSIHNAPSASNTMNSSAFTPSINTVYSLELEWEYSATKYNGIYLVGRYAENSSFSGMTEVPGFSVITDGHTPLTGVSEGLFVGARSTGVTSSTYFDSTSIYRK